MIEYLDDRPLCFSHLSDAFFFGLSDEGGEFGSLAIQISGATAHLHIAFTRFTHKVMRHTVENVWPWVRQFCKDNGCTTLVVSKENETDAELKKWSGFISHLGFGVPKRVFIATLGI